MKVSVPDLDESSFAPLFYTTLHNANSCLAPYPRSPVATRQPRCPLFPEWPQWSACCILDLSHSCPVSTPHVYHSSPMCNRVLTRTWFHPGTCNTSVPRPACEDELIWVKYVRPLSTAAARRGEGVRRSATDPYGRGCPVAFPGKYQVCRGLSLTLLSGP